MENLLFPMAIITGIFFALRFDYQGQSWGWGLLYGLFLSPIAAVHMLFVCVRWLSGNVGFGLIERDAASYMDTGVKHMFNEAYDKAIRDFDKVIELDPESPHAHEIRGRTYTLMSRYDNAIADFNKEISIVESYIENLADDKFGLNPYYFRGLVWTELSENERAIADFSKAIEFDPTSDGYVARAHAYIGLKQYGKAVQDYEEAISLNPNANLYLDKGRAYLELGDHDRALNDFSIALKLDPMQPNNHIETAAAHFSKGDFKRAISELDTGISMIPDFMAMHETLLEELKKEEQMEIYDEVVRDLAGLYAARGVCHLNIREYRKAIENFDDAIKMDAENGSYFRSRGGTYSQLTEHNLAIEDLDVAVRLCPDDSNAYFTRGIVRFNMEDFNGAIKDFDNAIELDPNFVDSYTGRGRCYLHLGQSVKALADLDKAVSLEDKKVVMPAIMNTAVIILESYYAYAIRGLVYSMMGDERSAERDFDKAIALGYDRSQIDEELSELDALSASVVNEPKKEVPAVESDQQKGAELDVSSKSRIVERGNSVTIVEGFTHRAKKLHEAAQARGESVHGLKPWYCSANLIENGASVAFIGSRPAGNMHDFEADRRLGILNMPDDPGYQAWLHDTHWGQGTGITKEQKKVWTAFEILFGENWQDTLLNTASFNVVASRFEDTSHISNQTWMAGMAWCLDVLYHISPNVIVCLGNGEPNGKSAWSIFRRAYNGAAMPTFRQEPVSGNYSLKHGHILEGPLRGTEVVGLPQLYMPVNMDGLRSAAERLGICPI